MKITSTFHVLILRVPTTNAKRYEDIFGVRSNVTALMFPETGSSYKTC